MLKLATSTDISIIQNLAHQIWQEHYVPIIGQAQVDYMLGLFYSDEGLLKQMNEGQAFYLIESAERILGFLAWSKKGIGEYFLNKFYIAERGNGIGEQAFRAILAIYPDLKTLYLTVNKNNFKSINFYFKMGFRIEKLAVFDIGEGYIMDDFLMKMTVR